MPRHNDDEIEQASHRFEYLADTLDPTTARVEGNGDRRAIAATTEASVATGATGTLPCRDEHA